MRGRRHRHTGASCAVATALAVIGLHSQTPLQPTRLDIRETVLGRFDPGADRKSVIIDRRTARRVAWTSKAGKWERVVVNGIPGPDFDEVKPPSFSEDGRRTGYFGKRNQKWFAVIDGREHGPYDRWMFVIFSPDGSRAAWPGVRSNQCFLVIDGVEHGPYVRWLAPVPRFSPDSRRVAYVAQQPGDDQKYRVFLDAQPGPMFDYAGPASFSADGQHVAYWVKRTGERALTLLVDGNPVATSAPTKGALPWELSAGLDRAMAGYGLPFTPDAEHLSYPVFEGKHTVVVINGTRGPASEAWGRLTFSGDWKRSAYVVADEQGFSKALGAVAGLFGGGSTHHPVLNTALVVDGEVRADLPEPTGMPGFSPDGIRLAYPSKNAVVVDGAPGQRYDEIAPDSLAWSPDGRRLAFAARRNDRWFVVVDGVEGPAFTGITALRPFGSSTGLAFTPDGRHVIYGAARGGTMSVVVHPGLETPGYRMVSNFLVFDTPGTLAFTALRGDEVVRVEVDLPE